MSLLFEGLSMAPEILLRSTVSLLFLLLLARLMGKKQLSQLSFSDYTIGISIGSIAAAMAVEADVPFSHGLIAMAVYALLSVLLSWCSVKSRFARKWLEGTPTLLIWNGRLLEKGLSKVRVHINDLLRECRTNGFFDIGDIAFAVMESNGKISFLPKTTRQPLTPGDLGHVPKAAQLRPALVIDGEILVGNCRAAEKTAAFVYEELERQSLSLKNVLLGCYRTEDDSITFYLKNEDLIPPDSFD